VHFLEIRTPEGKQIPPGLTARNDGIRDGFCFARPEVWAIMAA
jgi:hypothetical protein